MKVILVLLAFGFGAFKALQQPQFGVYLMSWIGYMSPHRLIPWSFVYSLPLAAGAFAVTVIGYVLYRDKPKNWFSGALGLLIVFYLWALLCGFNGFYPFLAGAELSRFFKILLGIFLTVMIIRKKEHIIYLVWIIYLSLGYYGIKGGIFTLATGGGYIVWGPAGTFVEGNNELALALLIILPLGYFLLQQYKNKWVRRALALSMMLMVISAIGSQSRGALLALISSGCFLWLKSKAKLQIGGLMLIGVLFAIPFLPDSWFERMETIQTYEEDASAMGRINSWTVAVNVANDRITGGGFRLWGPDVFAVYAPDPSAVHDAHSIYFEILGELGYPGLIMFLSLLGCIWFGAKKNFMFVESMKDSGKEYLWVIQLNKMLQVSLIAYMSGGAFLGLAYWDLPYHLLAIVLCCKNYLHENLTTNNNTKKYDA